MAEKQTEAAEMPTTYDTSHTSGGGGTAGGSEMINKDYVKSANGILQIVQAVLSLITFICAAVWAPWAGYGGGWVMFVSMISFILTVVLFFLYLTDKVYRIPGPFAFMQVCYYGVTCLLYFIAAIVASARSSQWSYFSNSITAAAVFAWFTLVAYAVHLVLQVLEWRRQGLPGLPEKLGGTGNTAGPQSNSTPDPEQPPPY